METPFKMDDLGVSLFQETSTYMYRLDRYKYDVHKKMVDDHEFPINKDATLEVSTIFEQT